MIIHRSFSGAALKNLSELSVNLMGKEADCEISPSPPLTCSFKKSGCQFNRELKNESDCCRPVSLRVRRHSPSNTKNNDFSRQYYSNGNENIPYTLSQCVDQVVSPVLCSVNDKQISTRNKETSKRQIRDPLKEIYSECAFPFSIFSDKNSKLPRPLKSPKNSNLNKNCSIIPKSQQKQAKKSTKFGNRKRNKPYLKMESTNSNLQFTTLKESFNKSYKNKKCSNTEEVSLLFEFPKKTTVNKIESNVKMSSLQCSTKHELKMSNNSDQNSTCLLKRKQPFQFLESGFKKSKTQLSSSENNNITSKTCLSDLNRCFDNNYSEDFIILDSLDEFEPLDSSQIHSPILGSTTSKCVSNAKYDETCVSPILGSAFRNRENPLKQDLKKVVSSDGELVIGDTNHLKHLDQTNEVEVPTRNKDIDFANENLVPQDMTFNHFRESISCCKQYSHSKEFMPKYLNSLVQVVSSPPEDSGQCTNVHLLDNANSMINKSVHKLENTNLKHMNLPIIEEPLSPVLGDCMNKKYFFPEKEDSNKTNSRLFSGNSYELKNKRFSSINDLVAVPNSSYENSFEKYVEYYSFGAQVNNEPMSPVLSSKIPKLETAEKKCERNTVVNERSNFPSESNSVVEPIFTLNVNDAKKPSCFGNLKSTSHKDSVSCLQTKSTPDTNRKHKTLKNKLHLTTPSATALLSTMPEKTNLSATKTLLCKNWEDEAKVSDLSSRITLSPVFDLNLKVGSIVSGLKEVKKLSPGPMFPIQINQKTKKPNFKCSTDLSVENSVLNVDLFDENNSNSEKIISPSTDSELDIIKYPIHFSHVELPLSPLLAADAKILFASMVESTEKNKSLSCMSKNNYKRKSSAEKIFDTSLSGKVVGQLMSQERKEVVSGVNGKLHEEESIDKCKSPAICNLFGSAKRTIVVESTANLESTDCQSHKKTVKKRLSFENTQFKNQTSSVVTNKKKLCAPKISEDEDIILSGIEKLPGVLPEQLEIVKENHIDFLKPNSKTSQNCSTRADCSLETEKKKSFNKVQNKLLLWKDFERNDDIMIEEFPEDYSSDNCFENSGKITTLETVKRNFNEEFTQCATSSKEYFMVPCEDMLSEVSDCKDEIQEALSQESLKSPEFNIECSSSPIKSSKETQNERSSGVLSFPPPLDVAANRTCNNTVLDSACKSKRTRMKKGSLVERLRRLVRAERAAVNMFHYEGAPGVAARACSLLVRCVMTTCSKLFIIGHYVNKYQTVSDEFSLGEEDMNPEVWLFTDPSYVRNITPGSIVMVYPPWQNLWQNGRGIMLIFGATKIQQVNSGRLPVLPSFLTVATLEQHYRCQSQQDQCCCRGTLMSQLFRVPVMEQGQCESHSWTQGSVMAALTGGCYPHPVQLSVTVLHRFHYRSHNKRSTASLLCVDGNGHICQINLVNMDDESKLEPLLMESSTKTLEFSQVVICKRVNIDRCQGLRSMLSQLHAESASQLLMYVATPLSDQWSARPSPTFTVQPRPLADITQGDVGRARARVCVMALRADHLYVWDKQLDSYYKINILSSAEVPKFPARAVLAIEYLCVQQDELTIDKFSTITVLGNEAQDSPTSIPSLSLQSLEGDLVLLDNTNLLQKNYN